MFQSKILTATLKVFRVSTTKMLLLICKSKKLFKKASAKNKPHSLSPVCLQNEVSNVGSFVTFCLPEKSGDCKQFM